MKKRITPLLVALLVFTAASTFAATAPVTQTGQSKCYFSDGTEIPCNATGQDGELKPGVAWPNPRFTDNTDGTMTDNLTGLIWAKNMQTPGPSTTTCTKSGTYVNWQEALDHVKCLNQYRYLNFNDWRLPTAAELASVVNYSVADQHTWLTTSGFTVPNISTGKDYYYWSSNTQTNDTLKSFSLSKSNGNINVFDKKCSYGVFLAGNPGNCANQGVSGCSCGQYWVYGSGCIIGGPNYNCDYMMAWPVRGNQ